MASQLIEEITAHVERDSLEDAREICADGTYVPNNLSTFSFFQFLSDKRDYNIVCVDVFLTVNHELTVY